MFSKTNNYKHWAHLTYINTSLLLVGFYWIVKMDSTKINTFCFMLFFCLHTSLCLSLNRDILRNEEHPGNRERKDGEALTTVGKDDSTNDTNQFLLKLTSSLARRIRNKLDTEHTLSATEVKLLEFFVKQIKQHRNIKTLHKKENSMKNSTLQIDFDIKDLLRNIGEKKNVLEDAIPTVLDSLRKQLENRKRSDNTKIPITGAIMNNTVINHGEESLSSNKEFIRKLAAALVKRVQEKLDKEEHSLTSEEIKVLEKFIDQIKSSQNIQNQQQKQQEITKSKREQLNTGKKKIGNSKSINDIRDDKNQLKKIEETEFVLKNIDKEITELVNELPNDVIFSATKLPERKQYHPNKMAVDPLTKKKTPGINIRPEIKDHLANILDDNVITSDNTDEKNNEEPDQQNKTVNDETESLNVNEKVNQVANDYINSMTQYTKNIDSRTDLIHERILNDILTFITKRKTKSDVTQRIAKKTQMKSIDNNVEDIENLKKMKVKEEEEREFSILFWKKLGLNTVGDDELEVLMLKKNVANEKSESESNLNFSDPPSNNSKKAVHCIHRPINDCRQVCLGSSIKRSCHRICLEKTKVDCITL